MADERDEINNGNQTVANPPAPPAREVTLEPDQIDPTTGEILERDEGVDILDFIGTGNFVPPEYRGTIGELIRPGLWEPLMAGQTLYLGSIAGFCTGYADREGKGFDGKPRQVTDILGRFVGLRYSDQYRMRAPMLYLPRAAAIDLRNAFVGREAGTLLRLTIDGEIGIVKTGRAIPYSWRVRSYVQDEAAAAIAAIEARQLRRLQKRGPQVLIGNPRPRVRGGDSGGDNTGGEGGVS